MKRAWPIVLLVVLAAAFALGVGRLFHLRFETGDMYPPYSSLRADPLGAMALYEALGRLPGVTARRDFSADNRLPPGRGTTYLQLGGATRDWRELPKDLVRDLETFLADGGRLVVALEPETVAPGDRWLPPWERDQREEKKSAPPPKSERGDGKKSGQEPAEKGRQPGRRERADRQERRERALMDLVDVRQRWGFGFGFVALPQSDRGDGYAPVVVSNRTTLPLPASLDWHSGTVLTNLDRAWQVVYERRGRHAVLAERRVGRGTFVLVTDSFPASNEALRGARQTAFLAWLVGPAREVVFDESHFGLVEQAGIAALGRKYRVHALFASLLALAALFLWKNSTSLLPAPARRDAPDVVPGRDARAGFVSLLRRSIPARGILAVCVAEWQRSHALLARQSPARWADLDAAFAADAAGTAAPDPVAAYRRYSELVARRGTGRPTR